MLLLISDANILMDIETGDLVASMFSLGYEFAVPNVLSVSADGVARVEVLSQNYGRPGRNDLFALALAEAESCPLLTGDSALKAAAESEKVEVKGTIWLISEMVREKRITVSIARASLNKMRENGRRLPWETAKNILDELEYKISLVN